MRYRWYYFKQFLRANRPLFVVFFAVAMALIILASAVAHSRDFAVRKVTGLFRTYGVRVAAKTMKLWLPAAEEKTVGIFPLSYLWELAKQPEYAKDPAYKRLLIHIFDEPIIEEENNDLINEINIENKNDVHHEDFELVGETITIKPNNSGIIMEKLADYDYLMGTFYSVHPTTTAGRDLMDAGRFLSMDFSLEKTPNQPQILIYHTHTTEEFSDYPKNPDATIVGVGTYLTELLRAKGYNVIHDTTVYDFRDGKLDRSQAYTYALDGITGILQKYPSIEVVLDIHRDGVGKNTRLVTKVDEKTTAQIMFFNGISQTPEGPIEYLPNPNREANLGFSFQLQLAASNRFPGLTRKIYLKGLRYNLHVRARSALIEVGAQTNTYEEARNAMEPLAELLDTVLGGES